MAQVVNLRYSPRTVGARKGAKNASPRACTLFHSTVLFGVLVRSNLYSTASVCGRSCLHKGLFSCREDLSGSSVCGLSSMLKMRCAALLILGVLTAVNGLKCYKNPGSGSDVTEDCGPTPSGSPAPKCLAVDAGAVYGKSKVCGTSCEANGFNTAGVKCCECSTDFCNTVYPNGTACPAAAPATPAETVQTDPLASSATGCFTAKAGSTENVWDWTAKTGCTCPSTLPAGAPAKFRPCRTCRYSGSGENGVMEFDCLACKGTDKFEVSSTTYKTGTCTAASAAAMLQAGTVVSAILAFAVALASA